MSIATAIQNAQQKVANAYTAVSGKGGTLPSTQDLSNLPTAINSIPTGSSPVLITKSITANGTYNASSDNADGYSSVTVNVSSSGVGITREVSANGVYQMPSSNFTFSLPSNATSLGAYAMYYAFYQSTGITSVNLSSLTTISTNNALGYAFYQNNGLTSLNLSNLVIASGNNAMYSTFAACSNLAGTLDLSSLTTISGSSVMYGTFLSCTKLTSLDLSSLTTISGSSAMSNTFGSCTNLTSVDLSSLATVSVGSAMNGTFSSCTKLTSISLPSLITVVGTQSMYRTFYNCSNLESISFASLEAIGTDTVTGSNADNGQFRECFRNCTKLTSITFPELTAIYCTGSGSATYGTFYNNQQVQKFYFPKLTTITYASGASSSNQGACNYIFSNCNALTEIHFGAANQAAIEATTGYATAWGRGAGNVTIYFDL